METSKSAALKLAALLELPVASKADNLPHLGFVSQGYFDPWEMFPCVYGSYSSDFDECAIAVLKEIQSNTKDRRDVGAEMFREILCTHELCEYGSSPRYCFPSPEFRPLLPALIKKWEEYALFMWTRSAQ